MGIKRTIKKSTGATVVTIGEAFCKFESEKLAKGLVASTMRNYAQSLYYFIDYCGFDFTMSEEDTYSDIIKTCSTDVKAINREKVIEWVNHMHADSLKVSAINHYLRDCKAFFNWCAHDDRGYINGFKIDSVKGQEPVKKLYKQDDLKTLMAKPQSKKDKDFIEWRNWAVVNLAFDMGARAGSIVEIRIEDINLKSHTIYLRHTKNKALANMNISSQCAKALKEYINDWRQDAEAEDFLFCNTAGEQLTYTALAHSYSKYCKARGVMQHNLHGLRHSFATALAENTNGDMVRVQKALGHSSIEMARKYVDIASVGMGNYDAISPLAKLKGNKGAPTRKIKRAAIA